MPGHVQWDADPPARRAGARRPSPDGVRLVNTYPERYRASTRSEPREWEEREHH